MGKVVGIDLGIASNALAVLNEDSSVEEVFVDIFEAADASKNVERRGFRQSRRITRRRKVRKEDFKALWENKIGTIPENNHTNVIELKVQALSNEITLSELYSVLKSALNHRGITYLDDADDETASSDYQKGLSINQNELETKYPCEIQKERLGKYGFYRGDNVVEIDGEKVTLSNVFTKSAYKKEIIQILNTQKGFHPEIDDLFADEYVKIFDRKREYYEGPGNELSRTDYGKYTTKLDSNGKYITDENIFEKLIGKCSVYPEELRAAGASYTAQLFNALNDLNDLTVNGRKISPDEKETIIKEYKSASAINVRKIIKKAIGEEIVTFTGYRIDKNDKEIYHTFEAYNKIRKEFEKTELSIDSLSEDDLDEIGYILTINTEKDGILKAFERSTLTLSEKQKEVLITIRKKNPGLFSKWQSFSLKIMQELIPEMIAQPKNQMQLLTEMGSFKSNIERFKESDKIPAEIILEEIYNPVVRRSVRISVKALNAILEKYNDIDKIVIEMPRDKNTKEEQDRLKEEQKNNENEIKNVLKRIKDEYGIVVTTEMLKSKKGLAFKLKLWNEQNGKCPYSGKPISIDALLRDSELFEVDHIIPLSISFDDSRSNKVLVYRAENQDKGQRTPYMYLSSINREWNYDKFLYYVKNEYNIPNKKAYAKKLKNFLFTEDINKIDVLRGFINRNINDTRYASRTLLNLFQSYFKANGKNIKVAVINGNFTHQMRVNMEIVKNRDESYSHHAVDAMLIALSQMGYDAYYARQKAIIDFETGEILDLDAWKNQDDIYKALMYQEKWKTIKDNIIEAETKVKYWYKVDKKCNRALCNQTIYSSRDVNGTPWKVQKLNIHDEKDVLTLIGLIEKGKEDRILMAKHDPQTFENIKNILEDYADAKNPFDAYEKETGDYVRKYSKKHNGPRIEYIKYLDKEVASCIDISHKYGFEKGSKKVFLAQLNPYRTDVWFNATTGKYALIGIKQSDIKSKGKHFVITEEKYAEILQAERFIERGHTLEDFQKQGYIFKFSLYKNDIIEYEKNGKIYKERFLSRTKPKDRNYIECKNLKAPKYTNIKQNLVGLSQTTLVNKYIRDITGNEYVTTKEKFTLTVE